MASYMFRVFNQEGQLVFEDPKDVPDINGVIAEARLVGRYAESWADAGSCDGWTVNVHGPSGALIMSLPWRFACQVVSQGVPQGVSQVVPAEPVATPRARAALSLPS